MRKAKLLGVRRPSALSTTATTLSSIFSNAIISGPLSLPLRVGGSFSMLGRMIDIENPLHLAEKLLKLEFLSLWSPFVWSVAARVLHFPRLLRQLGFCNRCYVKPGLCRKLRAAGDYDDKTKRVLLGPAINKRGYESLYFRSGHLIPQAMKNLSSTYPCQPFWDAVCGP